MNVLVVGAAQCVWDDLRALSGLEINAIVAVNRMIRDYPLMPTYGVSVHPEKAEELRRPGVPMVSTKLMAGVDLVYDQKPYRHGTSGLYGVGLALLMGAVKVICAGMPIDNSPHYHPSPDLGDLVPYRAAWTQLAENLRGRVFSLSGWTRELLGSPL